MKKQKVWLDLSNFIDNKEQDYIEFPIKYIKKLKDERFENNKPLKGKVKIFKSGKSLIAHFEIKTILNLFCDRCLKKISKRINLDFSRSLKIHPESSEDIKISANNQIEVSEPIRQEIILKIPIKILCRKNCSGFALKK